MMGSSLPLGSSAYEESCPRHEYCPFGSVQNIVKEARFEDIDISAFSEEDDLIVRELGIVLSSILNVGDSHECLPENDPIGDQCESWNQNEIENTSLDADFLQDFQNAKMSQCAREVVSPSSVFDANEGLLSMTVHSESCNLSTPKLVSAMKGARTQLGMPSLKLSVKWAPDVYDPPATAESHTVKGHSRRAKTIKKDHHKQKNSKCKSSRGNGGERKHASRRSSSSSSSIDPRILRLRALNGGIPPPVDSYGQPKLEVREYSARAQELKCGSSFYIESLAPMHLSIA